MGIGVVGVGALVLRGVLPHLTQPDVADQLRVVALCDPVVARATATAERFGVPKAYSDIADLLADPDVDAVTIASPIGLHYDHCRLALEAGKHVHVNKTMSTTVDEADRLIELATDGGLALVPSPGEILRPQVTYVRELLGRGAIGDVVWAICGEGFGEFHVNDEPERTDAPGGLTIDPSWYFLKPGGGPMWDMTVYALHQLTSVLGPASRVSALSGIRVPVRSFQGRMVRTEADDNTILLLDFGGGVYAVAYGTAAGGLSTQFGGVRYFGTRGVIDGVLLNGEPFDYPGRHMTGKAPIDDWDGQMLVLPHVVGPHRAIPEAHVFEDIMQLIDAVRHDKPTLVTAEHARHVIDIIESGYRAAETGSVQALQTTFTLPG